VRWMMWCPPSVVCIRVNKCVLCMKDAEGKENEGKQSGNYAQIYAKYYQRMASGLTGAKSRLNKIYLSSIKLLVKLLLGVRYQLSL
jgi:hypothetical protein